MSVVSTVVNLLDDNFQLVTLKPGDEIPAWAADRFTNPEVIATEPPRVAEERGEETEDAPTGYSALKKAELEALCEARGLDKVGNKPDLISRLEAADAAPVEIDLWSMDEGELRALAAERGVDVGEASTTAELAAALEQAEE